MEDNFKSFFYDPCFDSQISRSDFQTVYPINVSDDDVFETSPVHCTNHSQKRHCHSDEDEDVLEFIKRHKSERTFSQLQSSQNNHVTQSQLLHGNIPSDSQRSNADFQAKKLSQQVELTQHATLMQRPLNQSSQRNALPSSQTRSPKIGIVAPAQHAQSQQFLTESYNAFVPTPRQGRREFYDSQDSAFPTSTNDTSIPWRTRTPASLHVQGVTPGGTHPRELHLRSITELPDEYSTVFTFPYFNTVQSKVLDDVLYSSKSIALCAPTGSGKTVVFELAIIRLLMQRDTQHVQDFKVVYMAPVKALCSERFEDWSVKFGNLGVTCKELTGDSDIDNIYDLNNVQLILTTPEKWDSMTRRWRDNKSLVQLVKLFLIDEVHMLNDKTRGSTMEAVVSRMKTIQETSSDIGTPLRFIAVSATIPNVADVGNWLKTENDTASFSMDESYRPVRLRKVVLGYPCSEEYSAFRFDIGLNYKLSSIIATYSDRKPTLVFCATRNGVQQAASILLKDSKFVENSYHKQRLIQMSNQLRDGKLRDVVLFGIGFHHAGLDLQDRKIIEQLFLNGELPVLVATSTLAMGVNLPAHLVVVKSTQHYVSGMYSEYTETQVLQMIGRAGRPQFDTSATAVIMTQNKTKEKYENLLNGQQVIESSLHTNLVEHLNAEIALNTITDVSVAVQWLQSTFFYQRVLKNPVYYGLQAGLDDEQIIQKLKDLCFESLNSLATMSLLRMDASGFALQPTETGKLMASFCIAFNTMKKLQESTDIESEEDILQLICSSEEFRDIILRNNEKRILNTLNRDKNRQTIRYGMKGKIKTSEMKVNCLIQAQFDSLTIHEFGLNQDTLKIFRAAPRISKCLVQILWQRPQFKSLLNAVLVSKAFHAKLWANSKYVSKQLGGIGLSLSNALVNAGVTTFKKLQTTDPRELEMIMNRHPPFGNQIRDAVAKMPKYEVNIEQDAEQATETCHFTINVRLLNKDNLTEPVQGSKFTTYHCVILLIGNEDNICVFKYKISDSVLKGQDRWCRRVSTCRAQHGDLLSVHLISQDIVGIDEEFTFKPRYSGAPRRMRSNITENRLPQTSRQKQLLQNTPGTARAPSSAPSPAPGNVRMCNHTCFDKSRCAHRCCKTGVAIPKSRCIHPVSSSCTPKVAGSSGTVKRMPSVCASQNGIVTSPEDTRTVTGRNTLNPIDLKPARRSTNVQLHLRTMKQKLTQRNSSKATGYNLQQFAYTPHSKMPTQTDITVLDGAGHGDVAVTSAKVAVVPSNNAKAAQHNDTSTWNEVDYHRYRSKLMNYADKASASLVSTERSDNVNVCHKPNQSCYLEPSQQTSTVTQVDSDSDDLPDLRVDDLSPRYTQDDSNVPDWAHNILTGPNGELSVDEPLPEPDSHPDQNGFRNMQYTNDKTSQPYTAEWKSVPSLQHQRDAENLENNQLTHNNAITQNRQQLYEPTLNEVSSYFDDDSDFEALADLPEVATTQKKIGNYINSVNDTYNLPCTSKNNRSISGDTESKHSNYAPGCSGDLIHHDSDNLETWGLSDEDFNVEQEEETPQRNEDTCGLGTFDLGCEFSDELSSDTCQIMQQVDLNEVTQESVGNSPSGDCGTSTMKPNIHAEPPNKAPKCFSAGEQLSSAVNTIDLDLLEGLF